MKKQLRAVIGNLKNTVSYWNLLSRREKKQFIQMSFISQFGAPYLVRHKA